MQKDADPSKAPLATAFFRMMEPGVWYIIGSGAMYGGANGIEMNDKLAAVLNALKRDGVEVSESSSGSAANCSSYTFTASFDDGGLSVTTGNYWVSPRGGTIRGVAALERLIRILGLRVSPRSARAWELPPAHGSRSTTAEHLLARSGSRG